MKKIILSIFVAFLLSTNIFSQSVGINGTGANPNASAGLDVDFSNKGVLLPRVALTSTTVAAPITTPAASLLVYNTATAGTAPNNVTPGYYYWDGSKWVKMLRDVNSFTLPNTGVSNKWVELGTLTMNQEGKSAFIKVVSNSGYNADISQNYEVYIRFKTSNGTSVDANGFAGDATYYYIGKNGHFSTPGYIKIKSNAAGTAATSFTFYMYFGTYTGNGSFYTIETTEGTWVNSATIASDPGAASSSIQIPTMIGVGNYWSLSGNTAVATDFLGTTNAIDVTFKRNNTTGFLLGNGYLQSYQNHRFADGTAASPSITFTNNTGTGFWRPGANILATSTNGTERMRIAADGAVGIGKTPSGYLGAIVDVNMPMEVGNDGGLNYQARIGYFRVSEVEVAPETDSYGYVGYSTLAWNRMYAYGFTNVSEREKKKEIIPINQNDALENIVMSDIEKIKPSFYFYKQQHATATSPLDTKYRPQYQLGVIVDESPDYILDESQRGVDIYATATLALVGVKHNQKEIKKLDDKINLITLNDFGSVTEVANRIYVKFSDKFVTQLNNEIPIVMITPISEEKISLRIIEKTKDGFTVMNDSNTKATSFDWVAYSRPKASNKEDMQPTEKLDNEILRKIHLTPETKKFAKEHYSNIKSSPKRVNE